MKKLIFAFVCSMATMAITAQVKMPAPSPTQTLKQDFALGSIEVKYSRPAAKGRKVFGDLVPYNKLWRTGANAATLVKLNDAIEIQGKKLDTGSYVLYTIPGEKSWEVIFNKGLTNWGIDGYKETEDVLRFNVPSKKIKGKVENFTIDFSDIKPESCNLNLSWENTTVSIPVGATIKDRIRGQLTEALKGDKKPNWLAAQFYNEYDNNPAKALEYATAATNDNPKAFWVWIYKAKIEKTLGKKTDAMASSKKSLELAKEAKNDDYIKINEEFLKKL
ncbi:MAG TPA: DUF2911 domain-containing protein [Ferruginibacter sp.]|nr:DUF2911 domain-containing protein [Ferruginibacter sp.]HRE62926.1 DUF2911 domain-containing protein [Ferruginibacter sp.]